MSDESNKVVKEDYEHYRGLEYFEPVRQKIVQAISEKLSIPLIEFHGGNEETAFFHWITSLLAVERWLQATMDEERVNDREFGWVIARNKLSTAIFLRLFHHRFTLNIDNQSLMFLNAFGNVAGTNKKILEILIYGWDFMRNIAGEIGKYWWQNQSLPLLHDEHFDKIDEIINEAGYGYGFFKNAYRDAVMQMATEFSLLQKIQVAGNIDLAFPDERPEDADAKGIIKTVKVYLFQAAGFREPLAVSYDKSVKEVSFDESLKSLDSKTPKTLIESVYNTWEGVEAFVFFPNHNGDGAETFLLPSLKDAGITVHAVGFALV